MRKSAHIFVHYGKPWRQKQDIVRKYNISRAVAAAFFVLFILFNLRILYVLFVRLPCFRSILYSVAFFFCIISLSF